jgi:hypothetical protein
MKIVQVDDEENTMNSQQDRHERAYFIWENNGRPDGLHMDHWDAAGDDKTNPEPENQALQSDQDDRSEDPAEGSEEMIDRELDRQKKRSSRSSQNIAK